MKNKNILIVAGESSAENYGARLIREFKKLDPNYWFWGTGGDMMKKAGTEILYHIKELSLIGIFEVIFHIKRILNIKKHLIEEVKKREPSLAILIDFPDFNLSLAKQLKKMGIKVIYYISPTVWAWRYKRVKKIKKYVDKMLLIFPFERKIYEKEGVDYEFVGHPIFEIVKPKLSEEEAVKKYNPDGKIHIVLMPGSRISELKFHTPAIMNAIKLLKKRYQNNVIFSLIKASHLSDSLYKKYKKNGVGIYSDDKYSVMRSADLIISTSGTSNFEAMILKKPVVVIYKLNKLTYLTGKSFVKISNYSIVNILAGKKIIPEIIQNDLTGENIYKESISFLDNKERKKSLLEEYDRILNMYENLKNPSEKIAKFLWKNL